MDIYVFVLTIFLKDGGVASMAIPTDDKTCHSEQVDKALADPFLKDPRIIDVDTQCIHVTKGKRA